MGEPSASKAWNAAVTFLVAAGLLSIFSRTAADPDLWGHVLYGMTHLRDGALARTDPYSYLTHGQEWINHEVLSELVFGILYSSFGALGLIVFKTALALLIAGLLYRHLVKEGLEPMRAGVVVAIAALGLIGGLITVRPQMFTHLFFTLLLLTLVAAEEAEEKGSHRLWWIPLILALWINFHGGVLAGLGLLLVWAMVHVALRLAGERPGRLRQEYRVGPLIAVTTALAGAVALLANPYGWKLPEFLFRTATIPRPEIQDWQPLAIVSAEGAVYMILVMATVVALTRSRRPRNLPLLAALLVTAVMPLLAIRHLQLFAIAFVILAGGHLADAWTERRATRAAVSTSALRLRPVFIGIAVFAAVAIAVLSVPNFRCLRMNPEATMPFPARAVAVLEESGASGRLAVPFGWGQYAIWHLYPAFQVSMDGRRETVYPDHVYTEYLDFHDGAGRWEAHIDDPPADFALLQTGSAPYNLLSLRPDWSQLYRDETAAVFVREGARWAARLASGTRRDLESIPSDGAGLCFP